MEDAIFECEDFVEEYGIPLCDYSKFRKADQTKQKLRRAVAKAGILEKTLHISQMNPKKKRQGSTKSLITSVISGRIG